jgi:hypothetical protein
MAGKFALLLIAAAGVSSVGAQTPVSLDQVKEAIVNELLTQKLEEVFSHNSDNIQLKHIEPDANGEKGGWGVDYNWKYTKSSPQGAATPDVIRPDTQTPYTLGEMNFDITIEGSYAFGDAARSKDLSTIKSSFKLKRGNFGTVHSVKQGVGIASQKCFMEIPAPTRADDPEYDAKSRACTIRHATENIVRGGASYYVVDFNGGVEANQNYSMTHTLFGLTGAYASRPSEGSAKFNLFDAPFRLLRKGFSGLDDKDYVAPWPSLLLGLDRVEADEDDPRSALTEDETYTRARGEVAFNTQVANFSGKIVRFNVSWRYYKELSAPSSVKVAELDEFEFVTASLRFPAAMLPMVETDDYEFYVGYTSGRLPFGIESEETYEIGISTNIQTLADFLAAR